MGASHSDQGGMQRRQSDLTSPPSPTPNQLRTQQESVGGPGKLINQNANTPVLVS